MLRRAKAKYPSSKRNTDTDADILGICVCASDCAITARGRAREAEGGRVSVFVFMKSNIRYAAAIVVCCTFGTHDSRMLQRQRRNFSENN